MDFDDIWAQSILCVGACIEDKSCVYLLDNCNGILLWKEIQRMIENIFIELSELLTRLLINEIALAIIYQELFMYTIGIITGIVFYVGCVYLYFLLDRMVEKLGEIEDSLSDLRVDLAVTQTEIKRAQELVDRVDSV